MDPPGHGQPAADPEMVGHPGLDPHHVADGHNREARPVAAPVDGVEVDRAGGPLAAAEHVGAHHEVAVGVDRLAGTDQLVPPAGCGMRSAALAGGVGVAGEGVAHQHGVGCLLVELAPRLVGHPHLRQAPAPLEGEGPCFGDGHEPAVAGRVADLPGAGDRQPGREAPPGAGSSARGSRRLDVRTFAQPSLLVIRSRRPRAESARLGDRTLRRPVTSGGSRRTLGCAGRADATSPPGGGMAPWVSVPRLPGPAREPNRS